MKRALSILLVGLPLIPFFGCSASENPPEVLPTGGTSSGGSAGSSTAGTQAVPGGMSGSGPMAGSPATGGSSETAGSGGVGVSGGTGGVGGTGVGGSNGGTGGIGGGTGGGSSDVSVGKLDGFLVQTPCGDTPNSDDCNSGGWIYEGQTHACSGGHLDTDLAATKTILDFPVSGQAGKVYVATMHFYGVMEPKNYGNNVTRENGTMRPGSGNPATPAPFATAAALATYPTSSYNTYEIHVIDDKGVEVKQYFLNSDTQEGHYTFAIDYERPIEIIGGGKVHIRIYDDNCRQIKNCGTGGFPCAAKARTINIAAAMPAATVDQPGLGKTADHAGQWFVLDVKGIVAK